MSASASAVTPSSAPRPVKLAVILFAAALVVGLLDFALQRAGVTTVQSEALSSPLSVLFNLVITVGFLSLIMNRQNWARIIFAILIVLGLVFTVPIVLDEIGADPVGAMFSLLQLALQSVALVFLFRAESNRWFRRA